MSSPEDVGSQSSLSSLDLSQETVNQVLNAVGMSSGSDGNQFVEVFQTELTEADLEEELGPPVTGASSLSISRAIVHANSSVTPMWGGGCISLSQNSMLSSSQPPPLSALSSNSAANSACASSNHHTPTLSPHQASVSPHNVNNMLHQPPSSTHFTFDTESPLAPSAPPLLTPPPSTSLPPVHSEPFGCSSHMLKPNIPPNHSLPGEYNFELVFSAEKKRSKNTTITYSHAVKRAYIKQGLVAPFQFKFSKTPPTDSIIRAMVIHKAPEAIAENLVCCPKHVDEQKRTGKLFPYHFVRPQDRDTMSQFCEDMNTKRLSVTTPFSILQKKPPNTYTALYLFPCFTSEFQRVKQNVQLIFTLESLQREVLGRCTVDIRVCASPGRDRDVDERRMKGEVVDSPNGPDHPAPPTTRRGRKRGARSTHEEVIQCTIPPKQVCRGLSRRKIQHTITTFPEIIPFIEVCVKMMEQVYNVPVDIDGGASSTSEPRPPAQPSFTSVEGWLEHIGLQQHHNLLKKHGVNQLFQVSGVTEEELKRWGMRNVAHRKKFLDGKSKIQTVKSEDEAMDNSGSPPLFGSQSSSSSQQQETLPFSSAAAAEPPPPPLSHPPPPVRLAHHPVSQLSSSQQSMPGGSQGSHISVGSTQPFLSSTFEILQIQLRKKFNQQH